MSAAYAARVYAGRARAARAVALQYAEAVAAIDGVGLDQLARVDWCATRAAEAASIAAASANEARVGNARHHEYRAAEAVVVAEEAAEDARQILREVTR